MVLTKALNDGSIVIALVLVGFGIGRFVGHQFDGMLVGFGVGLLLAALIKKKTAG